jgi:hypothetical protein
VRWSDRKGIPGALRDGRCRGARSRRLPVAQEGLEDAIQLVDLPVEGSLADRLRDSPGLGHGLREVILRHAALAANGVQGSQELLLLLVLGALLLGRSQKLLLQPLLAPVHEGQPLVLRGGVGVEVVVIGRVMRGTLAACSSRLELVKRGGGLRVLPETLPRLGGFLGFRDALRLAGVVRTAKEAVVELLELLVCEIKCCDLLAQTIRQSGQNLRAITGGGRIALVLGCGSFGGRLTKIDLSGGRVCHSLVIGSRGASMGSPPPSSMGPRASARISSREYSSRCRSAPESGSLCATG